MSELTAAQRLDALRLARSENVGPVTYRELVEHFGTPGAALDALPELARRGGRKRAIKLCAVAAAEAELAALEALGARLVALGEPLYPAALAAIPDAPPVLGLRGQVQLLERPMLAIVGARNASAAGVRFTKRLAAELGQRELVIVSGLARGIDTAAHEGALGSATVAVVAGGADVAYPPENEDLMAEIASRGVVVSEMPPGTVPQARHFPRRNRIIAGLARDTLVVEAAPRSGSLITARLAGEQGREVMAVPGSPLDPRCRGSNNLIRQGAALIQTADDVIEALGPALERPLAEREKPPFRTPASAPADDAMLAQGRAQVASLLGPSPIEADELLRQSRLTPALLTTILLELELPGRLDRHPGNRISLVESDV